jgi:hypothetical protein
VILKATGSGTTIKENKDLKTSINCPTNASSDSFSQMTASLPETKVISIAGDLPSRWRVFPMSTNI